MLSLPSQVFTVHRFGLHLQLTEFMVSLTELWAVG